MTAKIEIVNLTGKETRLRRVNELAVAEEAIRCAATYGVPSSAAAHGGDVANGYGYAAATEGALAFALPTGECDVYLVRLPANKVTLGGVAAAVARESGSLAAELSVARYDGRYSSETWQLARPFVCRAIREELGAV